MTAALSQTALEFCRECEGFPKAKLYPNGDVERSFAPPRGFNDFNYHDLNAVMAAVREWCDKQGKASSYLLQIVGWKDGYLGGGYWQVKILGDELATEAMSESDDLCEALLAACVEAGRKLKTAHASL